MDGVGLTGSVTWIPVHWIEHGYLELDTGLPARILSALAPGVELEEQRDCETDACLRFGPSFASIAA